MTRIKTDDTAKFSLMLGANIKFVRLSCKPFKPQKVLAYHLGLSFQQVQKYESGKNIPCAYRLTQIADFYKVTPNDLVNPSYIHEQTKANEVLDKRLTPQDAGYTVDPLEGTLPLTEPDLPLDGAEDL